MKLKSMRFIILFLCAYSLFIKLQAQTTITVQDQEGNPIAAPIIVDEFSQRVEIDENGRGTSPESLRGKSKGVNLVNHPLYKVREHEYYADKKLLKVIVEKKTEMWQLTIQDHKGEKADFGQEVVIADYPELGTSKTDDFGIATWRIPVDIQITPETRYRVNGVLIPESSVRFSKGAVSIRLPPDQLFSFNKADGSPAAGVSVHFLNSNQQTDAKGQFRSSFGEYTSDDFKIDGYRVLKVEEAPQGWQITVEQEKVSTEDSTESDTVTVDEVEVSYDTVFVEKDFTLILEGLEIEKQYLIESSTELRSKIEYLNERLSSDSLTKKQKEEIRKYLYDLERTLIQNELAYQEAQLRTREVVEEMKRNLSLKDSLNELTTEKLETAEAEKEEVEAEFRKNMLIAAAVIGLTGLAAIILFAFSRKLQRQRNELAYVNGKLQETTSTLETKVMELDQERQKVSRQANNLKEMNTEISSQNAKMLDSIRYAQTIQASILPSLTQMDRLLREFFVIYKPKDIVSGDFYWFSHLMGKDGKGRTFIAVVDCTGHGVPGAFMSIVGNDLLNDIINQNSVHEPGKVLNLLNTGIHKRFRQSEYLNNDSMDIALCAIEKREGEFYVTFSGAKRPLYHYKAADQSLHKLRGNLKSVGGRHKKKPTFKQQEFPVAEGDMIYLSTDGFADQNDKDKNKIGAKGMEEEIKKIAPLPILKQKEYLENYLSAHQGEEEQRDDITLFAIRF